MASIFTKIINKEIPCYKVAETIDFIAFLDIFPLTKGHTLVIPKKEVDYIFDLDDATLAGLHLFSKQVAIALKKTIPCKRIASAVVGLEVPYAHIHLVPIENAAQLNFENPKLKFSAEEFTEIAANIAYNFN